jgi:hypothetical protein
MGNYYFNEAAFVLPELGFVDHTLHRLESPLDQGDPLGVEIRRVPLDRTKTLRQLVDGDVESTKAQVNGFTILEEAEVTLSSAPAVLLRARFRAHDVAYYQLKAHVAFEGTWMLFAVTGPYAERAGCDETFDRMVQSLKWRSG